MREEAGREGEERGGIEGRRNQPDVYKGWVSQQTVCVFRERKERGYSGAGDCSNDTPPPPPPPSHPPNAQPSLFSFCEEIYFFPCHAISDSHCCRWINWERAALSKWAFFFSSVALLRLCQIWVVGSDLLAVFNLSTWQEGHVREGARTPGLPQSNREQDHPYVKSFAGWRPSSFV